MAPRAKSAFRVAGPLIVAALLVPALACAQTPPSPPKNPSFNLVNKSDKPIRELFVTPAGLENWGQSRLEGKPLAPGGTFPVRLRADGNCVFDLRAVYADGKAEERRRVDTCGVDNVVLGVQPPFPAAQAAAGGTHDPSFRLINRGKTPITEVYATPAPGAKFSDNLLTGGATLAPDGSRVFHMTPGEGCSYDLRVVFGDKQSREKKAADLCKMTDLPVQ
jgi:hypothetical protein